MNDYFQFRQFRVGHRRSSMKIGTDAVLLGSWVDVTHARTILDVGTGTGILALMMAQRTGGKAWIDAIEIDGGAATDARENFSGSPWHKSLKLFHQPLQNFVTRQKYDLMITNPPYFINSLKPPVPSRHAARHADGLTYDALVGAAQKYLIKPAGRLALILPYQESDIFIQKATDGGLFLHRTCLFRSRPHKAVERVLMEFCLQQSAVKSEELCLYEKGQEWTPAYHALTRAFYLKD